MINDIRVSSDRKIIWKLNELMDHSGTKSIHSLSKETGLSRPTLTKILDNQSTRIDLHTVETLCNHFDCKLNDLIEIV